VVPELDRRLAVLGPHLYDGVPLSVAARQAEVPLRTVQRWLASYRADGAAGLTRSRRADRGRRQIPVELVELVEAIEGLALRRPPPQIAQIHRQVVELAEKQGVAAPAYQSVRRIVRGLSPDLLAHGRRDAYRDECELVLRREAARPNDMWQADHTELDVMILDEAGKPTRPWMTAILDDHSRAAAGYMVFLGDPNTAQASLALRQAIWRKEDPDWPVCGIPTILYVDHGADFISTHLSQVCADLRMQLIHSTAGKPRGRGKGERIFGSITTELLPTLPGHIPHGNGGSPITPPTLTLSEVDAAIGTWITTTYHRRVHPETGQTPIDRWIAPGWMPRMPESLDELNLLLLQVATPRKVLRDGIHLHGLRYLAITLAPYVGEPVTIRYDPRDLAEIRVYHHDEFLCRAVAPEIASVTISTQDLAAARNQRRRELRQKLTARRSLAELLTQPAPRQPELPTVTSDGPPAANRRWLKLYRED